MTRALGTIAQVSTGFPFRTKVESEAGGDLILVQIRDLVGAGGVLGVGSITLRSEGGKYSRYLLQAGDLLFQSRGNSHPVAMVDPGIRGIAAAGLHTIRPDAEAVLPGYLAWWLNHPTSQARFRDELARGTHVPFISVRDLADFPVPVPPLEVQRRIVEVERLHARERALNTQLMTLTQQLVAAATLAAARNT
jgi:restriction endonuclease S subunit